MVNKNLRDRLLKNTTIQATDVLNQSVFFSEKDIITTPIPMLNVALSGTFDGGLIPGLFMLAGPSKHFKTGFSLLLMKSFFEKYEDGIVLFYDSEFGAPEHYFDNFNIPKEQVVHTPITTIEELKFDVVAQLNEIKREDNIFIFVDSLGGTASLKEATDALEKNSKADMTRAKEIKSFCRIVTPHLNLKNVPMVCVNHTYKEIGGLPQYAKQIVGGGTGPYLSANDIWILGRQQDKDGKELAGYNFVITIEKSRSVKEKSVIPINVSFDDGVYKWSGLFENAVEAGLITTEKKGQFQVKGFEGSFSRDVLENQDDIWEGLIADNSFRQFIYNKYSLGKEIEETNG